MTFTAACLQMQATNVVAQNIATIDKLAREAAAKGASYLQTPEMSNILERDREKLFAAISPEEDDATLAACRRLAAELGVHFHLGSVALKAGEGKIANRGFLISPQGEILARYDKIHLFDVDLPNGESWRESRTYSAGEEAVLSELPEGLVGLSICYDVRFPHLYRALARQGAFMLTAPAAFTRQSGAAHWHVLQRARAIENGAYMISAAQAGLHADGRETFGHSIIVAPWGEVLAEAGGEGEAIVLAEIDAEKSAEARRRIPSLANERDFRLPRPPAGAAPRLRTA
ncbi:carbon-nitrogen hydrolase family protein [Afifella sp. IM 167]|uniref:carbon-nitrogen hydrolase family protein n=1 Tax=Afifella sp. IM 167 TaxID=2033586 RepID=UPI001CCBD54E|nr:carbon-nitrogen hydrolase family protein [Afifella sp. IM 167]MBZ8133019.1 amidohydrolase [Afifella sp. IM 167]